jgi:hypothetical protein
MDVPLFCLMLVSLRGRAHVCLSVKLSVACMGCVSELDDFATLFFLVRQLWGRCRYRHFAANFKAF